MDIKRLTQRLHGDTPGPAVPKAHGPLLPKIRRDDDIFLVSFPKSGNTWISFIIANMIIEKLGLDMMVNHFNIHGFVPDIHQGQDLPSDMGFFPFKRIIKSHAYYHPEYKNVLYILRDPRSVMVSYHKFVVGLDKYDNDLDNFIRDNKFGIKAWVTHVRGWLDGIIPGTRFRILKYEDFKANPVKSVGELAELLGVSLTEESLNNIIEKSTFESMRRSEESTGSISIKRFDAEFKFVRKGKSTGWKNELSKEQISYINDVAGELMAVLGYEV